MLFLSEINFWHLAEKLGLNVGEPRSLAERLSETKMNDSPTKTPDLLLPDLYALENELLCLLPASIPLGLLTPSPSKSDWCQQCSWVSSWPTSDQGTCQTPWLWNFIHENEVLGSLTAHVHTNTHTCTKMHRCTHAYELKHTLTPSVGYSLTIGSISQ